MLILQCDAHLKAEETKCKMEVVRWSEARSAFPLPAPDALKQLICWGSEEPLEVDPEGIKALSNRILLRGDSLQALIPLIFVLSNALPNVTPTSSAAQSFDRLSLAQEDIRKVTALPCFEPYNVLLQITVLRQYNCERMRYTVNMGRFLVDAVQGQSELNNIRDDLSATETERFFSHRGDVLRRRLQHRPHSSSSIPNSGRVCIGPMRSMGVGAGVGNCLPMSVGDA